MFLTLFGKVKKEEKLHRSMPEFLNFLFYIPLILLIYLVDVVFRVHRFRRVPWRFLVPDCHMELLTKRNGRPFCESSKQISHKKEGKHEENWSSRSTWSSI